MAEVEGLIFLARDWCSIDKKSMFNMKEERRVPDSPSLVLSAVGPDRLTTARTQANTTK